MILKLINCLQEKNEKFNKNSSNKKIVVKIDQKQNSKNTQDLEKRKT